MSKGSLPVAETLTEESVMSPSAEVLGSERVTSPEPEAVP